MIIDAIVAPADDRNIAMMRDCLVSAGAPAFGEADAARARDFAFLTIRGAGLGATLVFDWVCVPKT